MRLNFVLYLLTLVLVSRAEAKPHQDAPAENAASETHAPVDPATIENLSISPAPNVSGSAEDLDKRVNRSTYYYPYKKTFTVYIGTVFGIQDSTNDENFLNYLAGFSYMLRKRSDMRWEVSADLLTLDSALATVSRRRIYTHTAAFRPYYRYGISHKFVHEERLASLSNFENYLARVGFGFEDIRTPPKSIRLELELAAGSEDILGLFTIGYAWGL